MSTERNKARVQELLDRVLNGHDLTALEEFTTNPAVQGSGSSLVRGFSDLQTDMRWIVADGDMVVVFFGAAGTHDGPWLSVQEPTGRPIETSFMLAFQFDDSGQIVDQWLGSNFVEILIQLGWGFAPVGEVVPQPRVTHSNE